MSCAIDPVPTNILKQIVDHIIEPITCIVNKCLSTGIFPSQWKSSVITPVIKKQNLDHTHENFRPVSNLTFLSKILEKTALKSYIPHLETNDSFSQRNSAYKKHHSTETLITKIHSNIMSSIDKDKLTLLVLLDLSAAFETVNQTTLINIFSQQYNIRNNALSWIKSYLTNRTFRVSINNSLSSPHDSPHGVPQGSCIGPVAFLTYIGGLYDIIGNDMVTVEGYADDTQLYISFNPSTVSAADAILSMNQCIKNIRNYFLKNQLLLNENKTEVLVFGKHSQLSKIDQTSISIGNQNIHFSDSAKYLGVIFDKFMSLDPYIKEVCKKSHLKIRRIRQIRPYLTQKATESLVHSLISSSLDYCNSILYNTPSYLIKKLQLVQNTAAKLITRSRKYDHVTPIFKELHWLPVKQRIKFKIALLTFKALNNLAPKYLSDLIQVYTPNRTLRSQDQHLLKIPHIESNRGSKSFSHSAIWNSLPPTLRECTNIGNFKKLLKSHLFDEAFRV